MQTPRQNKAVRTPRTKAGDPVAAAPQCPKPGPCGPGWPIPGKGVHEGTVIAWCCPTHGRTELVTVPSAPEPVGDNEQAVMDEWTGQIAEQQAIEDAAAEEYATAVTAWADAELNVRRAEAEDGDAVFSSRGWVFPKRRPDLLKLSRELAEARTALDDAERGLQRQRSKTAKMYQTMDQAQRCARDKDRGFGNGFSN